MTMTIEEFAAALSEKIKYYHAAAGNKQPCPTIELQTGARYVRIVRVDQSSRSAYGFIDKTNGDLLFSAGWKGPAKHARGNLADADPLKSAGPYGFGMLRR